MAKAKKSVGSKSKKTLKTKATVKASSSKAVAKASKTTGKGALSSSASPQVLEYKLFVEDSVRSLEDQVNYYISKGWAPVGGVVLQGQSNYLQTMVRQKS